MSNNIYARMWELNSEMLRLQHFISGRERFISYGADDAEKLRTLNARDRWRLDLAKREHRYWKDAYVLETYRLIDTHLGRERVTLDAVVVAQRLCALDLLTVDRDGEGDPEMEAAARRGLLAWEQALERVRADLERYGGY